jgi:hypothetical protein
MVRHIEVGQYVVYETDFRSVPKKCFTYSSNQEQTIQFKPHIFLIHLLYRIILLS